MTILSENKCFGGSVKFIKHQSTSVNTEMTFSVFVPPQAQDTTVPVLYWLSGLTCTADNFTFKAGAFRKAAELGIMIVCPDTSPRGAGIEGEDERYDLGSGAGFYVDATSEKWSANYQMYSYVTDELPGIVAKEFNVTQDKKSIFGHSMGGHGALVCAFRNPQEYVSVSAFAPICAPSECPWGQLALTEYLGEDKNNWVEYDANLLAAKTTWRGEVLIEQGTEDQFFDQLNPALFEESCLAAGIPLRVNMREGYDHSYYFISSFVDSHLEFHAKALLS